MPTYAKIAVIRKRERAAAPQIFRQSFDQDVIARALVRKVMRRGRISEPHAAVICELLHGGRR